ncbi:MAG TPA: hypothetical protein V6D05_06885 [Stenomitos sp.]
MAPALTQERLAHALVLPMAPAYLALKARTPTKHEQLATTWALLRVLFLLTGLHQEQVRTRPLSMLRAEKRPSRLNPTGWSVGGGLGGAQRARDERGDGGEAGECRFLGTLGVVHGAKSALWAG